MSTHLENAFELPNLTELVSSSATPPSTQEVSDALNQAKDLESQFEKINGFDQHDREMDEISEKAMTSHIDLMELGMNVEVRYAGEIFSVSAQMLKIAADVRNNKVEKKLKLLRLQIDKMRIDKMSKSDDSNVLDGNAMTLDRNEILKQLQQINKQDK